MKAGLIVPRVTADAAQNLDTIERMAAGAVAAGARLLVLPEAVVTGLINNDDAAHDLLLALPIPGPATDRLGAFCARHGCWLAFGLLERVHARIYDSAVLLQADGAVGLVYRRIQPQWHGPQADPAVYCQGTDLPVAQTPFGRAAFLLCGDLFDDDLVARFRDLDVDWLLFAFARDFADGRADQARWDAEEMPEYARRVEMAGAPALMVNYLAGAGLEDDHCFGGAFAISAEGQVVARLPLGEEGVLLVETDRLSKSRRKAAGEP